MRKLLKLAVAATIVAGSVGVGSPAQAYCEPTPYEASASGGCSNSCTDPAVVLDRLLEPQEPWACPM